MSNAEKAIKHLRADDNWGVHALDRSALREVLIVAACPIVCVGHRQQPPRPDWHEWCERKADAALLTLLSVQPPPRLGSA